MDQTAPATARQLARREMHRRILASARRQLTEVGPAQLSLRAVARDLGVASSAVYRYVASRDELITRMILEIYGELGGAVGTAAEAAAPDAGIQWRTWASTLRRWALDHPYDWALVYGTPIPGYAAPQDTVGPATRVDQPVLELSGLRAPAAHPEDAAAGTSLAPFARLLAGAGTSGSGEREVTAGSADVAGGAGTTGGTDAAGRTGTALAMLQAWSTVHGFINLELGGHFQGVLEDPEPVFEALVRQAGRGLGLS